MPTPRLDLLSCRSSWVLIKKLDAATLDWVASLPAGPPEKDGLARIVEAEGRREDAENSYYEAALVC
jgi:hypothetical protein